MNSILQVMMHNPILKAYFLSGKHNYKTCENDTQTCMACQMDILFEKFQQNEKLPITPHQALYAMVCLVNVVDEQAKHGRIRPARRTRIFHFPN
jgi:hypothetical protein